MINEESSKITRILRALGDDTRFQIIWLLLGSDLCVGALARILHTSKPAVSQHLKVLREAGLVKGEKRGYFTHYMVEKDLLHEAAFKLQELAEGSRVSGQEGAFVCLRKQNDGAANYTGDEQTSERRVLQMCENCCEKPEKLKTKPEECTPEQIKECHGDVESHSCESGCEQPDKLKTKPEECTPEQIRECHGDDSDHPCK